MWNGSKLYDKRRVTPLTFIKVDRSDFTSSIAELNIHHAGFPSVTIKGDYGKSWKVKPSNMCQSKPMSDFHTLQDVWKGGRQNI